ncbi:MAG TPA: VCBS repeat-containing protein [Candidatus Nanoarchaeia archaeon]|nr:VCBS repeat-containing protein [Candidatus Nanoarchaeia archaeon]
MENYLTKYFNKFAAAAGLSTLISCTNLAHQTIVPEEKSKPVLVSTVWADFNRDGLLDLAVARRAGDNSDLAEVYISFRNGKTDEQSRMAPLQRLGYLPVGPHFNLSVVDYGRDNNLDLALVTFSAEGTAIPYQIINHGDRRFTGSFVPETELDFSYPSK